MGVSSCISKAFLFGFNRTEVYGLQRFLDILDSRADPSKRQRGLVTGASPLWPYLPYRAPANLRHVVSNHISVYVPVDVFRLPRPVMDIWS